MGLDLPSFNGPDYKSNRFGIIEYEKPLLFEVIQVRVEPPTNESALIGYPPPEKNQIDGSRYQNHFKIIALSAEKNENNGAQNSMPSDYNSRRGLPVRLHQFTYHRRQDASPLAS